MSLITEFYDLYYQLVYCYFNSFKTETENENSLSLNSNTLGKKREIALELHKKVATCNKRLATLKQNWQSYEAT